MEGVPTLRELLKKKKGLNVQNQSKNTHIVVSIYLESENNLTLKNEGVIYQYRALAFGLNVAPRVFSK